LKVKLLFLLPVFIFSLANWHYNLDEAEKIAKENHKYILLNFSGSDWCGPCMRMQKEIFESEVFLKLADEQLILVNADFPRKRKNQLSAGQQKINDGMADKYNPQGKFPYTLLLNSEGRVIKSWEGLPEESAEIFTVTIRNSIYTNQAEK
jgi:thioredoxin-related protein